jgi:two-component system OmpR family sensor kinase
VMESYLLGQVDARLTRMSALAERGVGRGFGPWQQEVGVLRRADGSTVDLAPVTGKRPELPPVGSVAAGDHVTVGSVGDSGTRWRAVVREVDGGELVIATSQVDVDNAVDDLRRTFLLISIGALVLMAGAGHWLVRGSMRPLEEVEATAEVIATGELSLRVPVRRPGSEVGRLATALNAMLGQIEQAFHARTRSEEAARVSEQRMRRFVADASHELRTPLARMRAELEADARQPDDVDPAATRESLLEEIGLLQQVVDDMLMLVRSDLGMALDRETVDLDDLLLDEIRARRGFAAATIDAGEVSAAQMEGSASELRRVIRNLLDNSLRHAATTVRVSLSEVDGRAVLVVEDDGPGIPAEWRDVVFERFRTVRTDAHDSPGIGLGLSIVAEIVERHDGQVTIEDSSLGGARVVATLPMFQR